MDEKRFIMEGFEKKPAFSGFLPGIAGVHGIPIWCYYVNRGQAVVSFGVEDKDHAIMEFFPAHQAYQNAARVGFRTFVRQDGRYKELFAEETEGRQLHIGMNSLGLSEDDEELKLHSDVEYYTLPGEKVGALVRKLSVRNTGEKECRLEVLDGMPVLIPYGVDMGSVKSMGQTTQAWMQVEDEATGIPYFRVRASMGDTACVTAIEGGNFSLGCDEAGNRLPVLVDPSLVFGYDSSLGIAVGFREKGLALLKEEQVTSNQYPCSFFAIEKRLQPGESLILYQMVGQVADRKRLESFLRTRKDTAYFEEKREQALKLTEELCTVIDTKTASPEFDAYSKYTYMDNVLRGGFPLKLAGDKIFYVYSRKHGDLERDYNYYRMLPEFYSQGNGNFRDVNQNRRCDPFFTPYVGTESIDRFYSLIQLDGYNPLAVEKVTYTLQEEKADTIFDLLGQEQKEELFAFLGKPFTPGQFFGKLEEIGIEETEEAEAYFSQVMEQAESMVNADFGEGYWSDHWTYNLDLVENYLSIFPEKEKELLYKKEFTWYRQQISILPRRKRYVNTDNGIRQYKFLDHSAEIKGQEKLLRSQYGKGDPIHSLLIEKLIVLCATKYAALDAYGMGVEMEGGKPGWYDALNGMPGVFGSSMAETYELSRMLDFTIGMLRKYPGTLEMLAECADFLEQLGAITADCMNDIVSQPELVDFWNRRNDAKESYWNRTFTGISGARKEMQTGTLMELLIQMQTVTEAGIRKACAMEDGICPTYFTFEVMSFTEDKDGIYPEHFEVRRVPLFLEGPVRYMKLPVEKADKQSLYCNIRQSDLYDGPLQMYKVNASLGEASIELGRAKAFTPGWLENESVWLHMEYKYLLELLKSGLYEEYAGDFHKAAVPFLDPAVYGRSIYENSSFIASSKNPNKAYRGQGFVARLSGSTAEFLQMWILMMFGRPFTYEEGELGFAPRPVLPAYLIGEDKKVEAMFMGSTRVVYELAERKDYFPGAYHITEMELTYLDGSRFQTNLETAKDGVAEDIRAGKVKEIRVAIR